MKTTVYLLLTVLLFASCKSKPEQIAAIEFSTSPCFGTCPIFSMTIAENGTATYDAESYNTLSGKFKTVIKKESLDSLHALINKVDWSAIKNKYTADITDQASFRLTLTFKSGKRKEISDYGQNGPKDLIDIYVKIISFRDSQAWK
ncbi:MAG: DUF6438 domain-containing protein [Ferruginibacter sp.]